MGSSESKASPQQPPQLSAPLKCLTLKHSLKVDGKMLGLFLLPTDPQEFRWIRPYHKFLSPE